MAIFYARVHLMVINLATYVEILLRSFAASNEYIFAINCALHLIISSNASSLVLDTHLHPLFLRFFGSLVNFNVVILHYSLPLACIFESQWFIQIQMIIQQFHIGLLSTTLQADATPF
jgi:hypothetical protein